jgi:hypothetical protein
MESFNSFLGFINLYTLMVDNVKAVYLILVDDSHFIQLLILIFFGAHGVPSFELDELLHFFVFFSHLNIIN